jgi:5-methylcytosine-specific restriction endonuclease McrA
MTTTAKPEKKKCGKCGDTKDRSLFFKRNYTPDGNTPWCKDCHADYQRERIAADPEARAKVLLEWARAHPKERAASTVRYRKKNAERHRAYQAEWYARDPKKRVAVAREWQKKNPAKQQASVVQRRARRIGTTSGPLSTLAAFYKWAREAPSVACYWCHEKTIPGRKHRQVDHVIPLARGGTHTLGNLCISCRECNRRKWAHMPEDFSGQAELRLA